MVDLMFDAEINYIKVMAKTQNALHSLNANFPLCDVYIKLSIYNTVYTELFCYLMKLDRQMRNEASINDSASAL